MWFDIGEAEIGRENGAYALRGVCGEASVPGAFPYGRQKILHVRTFAMEMRHFARYFASIKVEYECSLSNQHF